MAPFACLILAFTVFGGASIINSINGVDGFAGDASPEAVLFNLFDTLPFNAVMPFVLILMVWAFLKDLSTDPARIPYDYARQAVSDAVIRGIEDHGEEFEFAVKHSPDGRGAGTGVEASEVGRRSPFLLRRMVRRWVDRTLIEAEWRVLVAQQ